MSSSQDIQQELVLAREKNINRFRNEILLKELRQLEDDSAQSLSRNLNDAIKSKYNQVSEFITISSFSVSTIQQTLAQVSELKLQVREKQLSLGKKVAEHVKTVLQVLDVTWSVIEELKLKTQKGKNVAFDNYYKSLVDTMLLKAKILHLTVLIATYDDEEFITALKSLKSLLDKRYKDAETMLTYTTQQIEEYNDIGPEFKTLSVAYKGILDRIQATKDDIDRIRNY